MTRSGAAAASLPTCKYFEVMRFLHEKSSNKQTDSNLNVDYDSAIAEDFANTCMSPTSDSPASIPVVSQKSSVGSPSSGALSPKRSTTPVQKKKDLKRRHSSTGDNASDDLFLRHMKDIDEKIVHAIQNQTVNPDEATVFCDSIKPVLQGFDKKKTEISKN